MNNCSYCWSHYMDAMARSRLVPDPYMRRALIREAYIWLDRYFDAENRELGRRRHLLNQR